MTDAQFLAWLKSPAAIRMVLVEAQANVAGVETTRYLATRAYVTGPVEMPPNTIYAGLIEDGLSFTEELSIGGAGSGSLSTGDIVLDNGDGAIDGWFNDVWVNRPLVAWVGDPRWPRADFRMIFNGIMADIDPTDETKLGIKLNDKMQMLNTAASDALLGGTTSNAGAIIPDALGEVFNITPLSTNPATLEYQWRNGPGERIIEVRDNGVPVHVTEHLDTGKFNLLAPPAGVITCSVQGDKSDGIYRNTIAQLVQLLVTSYGTAGSRFTAADLDADNLAAFDAAHQQPVGLYLAERTNVIAACQQLAVSVAAQLSMSRAGTLRLLQVALPAPGSPTTITVDHMLAHSLSPKTKVPVAAAVTLGYLKNWTPQANLQTSLPSSSKDLLAKDWTPSTSSDDAVQALYRLTAAPVQIDTCLLRKVDADTESARQRDLAKVPRMIYEFDGEPEMLLLELGQPINVIYPRFGMDAGKQGIVVSLAPNWLNSRCTVGFMV